MDVKYVLEGSIGAVRGAVSFKVLDGTQRYGSGKALSGRELGTARNAGE